MTADKPTRRDLLKPVQLLGFAFGAAAFAGVVTLMVMGFFQRTGGEQVPRAVTAALVIAGITFIVTLVGIALLILAVDPAQVTKQIDRPVLQRDHPDDEPDAAGSGVAPSGPRG